MALSALFLPKIDRQNIDTEVSACRNIGAFHLSLRVAPLQGLTRQLDKYQPDIRKGRLPDAVISQGTAPHPAIISGVPSTWVLSVYCVPCAAQSQAWSHVRPTCLAIRSSSAASFSTFAIPAPLCRQRPSSQARQSAAQLADDVWRPSRTAPEQPERYKNGTSSPSPHRHRMTTS